MSRTGGGRGTNQYQLRGVSRARVQGSGVLDDLSEESELTRRTHYPDGTVEEKTHDSNGQVISKRIYGINGLLVSEYRYRDGQLNDPPDGSPAVRVYRSDASLESEHHYHSDKRQDPPDGGPALREYSPDGSVIADRHYRDGVLQDPDEARGASRYYRSDGSVALEFHYRDGKKV